MLAQETSTRAADIAARSLLEHFLQRTASDPERVAVRWKSHGIWRESTWSAYRAHVEGVALGLLELGIAEGSRVAVLGRPSPAWLYADLAAQSVGALPVPIHATMAPAHVTEILASVRPTAVLLTRSDQLDWFRQLEPTASSVEHVIVGQGIVRSAGDSRVVTLDDVEALGSSQRESQPDRWPELARSRSVDAPAVIAVSAGTTTDGRLGVLTGANLLGGWSWLSGLPTPPGPSDRIVSSMALGQVAERALSQMTPIVFGSVVHFPEDALSIIEARREIKPTIYFALAQVWESESAAACEALDDAPVLRRLVYRLAVKVGVSTTGDGQQARAPRRGPGRAIARRMVFRPLVNRFGYGRLRVALSGGDCLAPAAANQWRAWGLPVRQVYGAIETAGVAAVGDAGDALAAAAGVELAVAEDGELVASGPNVMHAYFDGDPPSRHGERGLRTGDHGDRSTGLRLLGPTARRLRLEDGSAVDPVPIEAVLRSSRYIARAAVVGQGWPALGALLEIDLRNLASWASRRGMSYSTPSALLDEEEVLAHLATEVATANEVLAQRSDPPIAAHRVVPRGFTVGRDVTPSGSVRPAALAYHHRALLDVMQRELTDGGGSPGADGALIPTTAMLEKRHTRSRRP